MPGWMSLSARTTHVLLYGLLFAVPVTAVLGAWLQGHPLSWLGGDIAAWFPTAYGTGTRLAHLHGWLGDAILWLAGLHAAAALVHHLVLRDRVLVSMLPRWRSR